MAITFSDHQPSWMRVIDDLQSPRVTIVITAYGMERRFEALYDAYRPHVMQLAYKQWRELRRIHEVTTALEGK